MSLKDNIKFYTAAVPKVLKAYSRKAIGEVATTEEQKFRKAQCESCVLFNGSNCNKNIVGREEGNRNEYYELKEVENNPNFIQIKDKSGILRIVQTGDGKRYYRGCGCPLTGAAAKWKLSFSSRDLSKIDGTGPCPMGKWSEYKFKEWKNESS